MRCCLRPSHRPATLVIPKDAKTENGVFTVDRVGEDFFYEIPKEEFGQEFLWNSRIGQTAPGVGFDGFLVADHIVRWEFNGQRVLLRDVNYEATPVRRTPMAAAVKASNTDTIVIDSTAGR